MRVLALAKDADSLVSSEVAAASPTRQRTQLRRPHRSDRQWTAHSPALPRNVSAGRQRKT